VFRENISFTLNSKISKDSDPAIKKKQGNYTHFEKWLHEKW